MILDKLKKIQELAKRGEPGERDNAQKLLEELAAKYGVDLDSISEDIKTKAVFQYSTSWERKLLGQICFAVANTKSYYSVNNGKIRKRAIAVDVTPAQAIEIDLQYGIYRKALKEHMDIAYDAFVQQNNIFPENHETPEDYVMDIAHMDKVINMMSGTEKLISESR